MARSRSYPLHSPPRLSGVAAIPTRDAEGRPLLRLQTLGAATILIGESRLNASAGTLFSLLLRVSCAPGALLSRDVVLASLWPDQALARQRANLRQALYKLRGHDVRIAMLGDVVQLDQAQIVRTFSVDRSLETFERDVTHGVEPFGTFLPGFTVPWPEFQEWVLQHREAVHADVRRVLIEQLRTRRERADWGGADALARWLLQFDPLNEEATLTVAECTALSGSKKEGIAILDRYLAELGPDAGDLRLQATMLRRRISELGARTRSLSSPTERYFVGREKELADLTMSMRRARWHDGSAVLMYGPPGIGKSRLLRELEKVAALEGVRVVHTACRESELNRPLSVFLDLLPQIIALPGALGCAPESLAALRLLLPKDASEAVTRASEAEFAGTLHEPTGGESERPFAYSGLGNEAPSAASLRRSILDLIASVSEERPLVIAVEDVHWIDEQSWDALSGIIEHVHSMRVFVVLNSRVDHARPAPPQRSPLRLLIKALGPLPEQSSFELSLAIAEDLAATVTSDLGDWFAKASEGVPLFLHALVVHWVETGEAGGVPPTLRGVIEHRLDRLDGSALHVVQASTLLGRWATVERVQKVLELRANEMIGCLDQIESLCVDSPSAAGRIQPHDLLAAAASQSISVLAKRAFHLRIGECLFADGEADRNPNLTVSALDHFAAAGDESLLLSKTLSAREQLLEVAIPETALEAVLRASSIARAGGPSAELERTAVRLHLTTGNYRKALEEPLGRARLPLLNEILTDHDADEAIMLADAAIRADRLADREHISDIFVTIAERSQISRAIRLRAADAALMAYSNDADFDRANRVFLAVAISPEELLRDRSARNTAIVYHTIFGDKQIAESIAHRLLDDASSASPSAITHQLAMRAGFSLRVVGRDLRHIEGFELAFNLALAAQMPRHALNVAVHQIHSLMDTNEFDRALHWRDEVLQLFTDANDPWSSAHVYGALCRVAIEEEEWGEAGRLFSLFSDGAPENPSRKHLAFEAGVNLDIELGRADRAPDDAMVESFLARRALICNTGTSDYLTAVAVNALRRSGQLARARALLERYESFERRELRPFSAALRRSAALLESDRSDPFFKRR